MKHWTLDEATAALPEVRVLVQRLRELTAAAGQGNDHASGNGAPSGNGQAARAASTELRAAVRQLTDRGIVVRDPARGLIDFPARSPSGRDYLLCWLDGEAAIEWWHWPDAGFPGRTTLREPPE